MIEKGKCRLLLGLSLSMVLTILVLSPNVKIAQAEPFTEVREKLSDITEEERAVLKNLFLLAQELEEMEIEEEVMTQAVDVIKRDINELEGKIQNAEIEFHRQRDTLKQVLQIYQRRGPGSYLEIMLDSDNLSIFLRKLNILRELTRNTGKLLDSLDESRDKLSTQKVLLSEKLLLLVGKQEELRESMTDKLQIVEQKEQYLTSLGDERDYYQGYLAGLQLMWNELRPLFAETTREFTRIIKDGSLPMDTMKTTFTIYGIKASIDEKVFNNIIAEHTNLPQMVFNFYKNKIEIEVPEKNLILWGKFVVVEGHTLKYQIDGGSFYGMPLEARALEELFKEGHFMVNFKPFVGDNTLQSIDMLEGHLELLIKPVLFK